jgi:hypothetical protein
MARGINASPDGPACHYEVILVRSGDPYNGSPVFWGGIAYEKVIYASPLVVCGQ